MQTQITSQDWFVWLSDFAMLALMTVAFQQCMPVETDGAVIATIILVSVLHVD